MIECVVFKGGMSCVRRVKRERFFCWCGDGERNNGVEVMGGGIKLLVPIWTSVLCVGVCESVVWFCVVG